MAWLLLLTLAFGLATMAVGWWAVPLVGLAAGFLVPATSRPTLLASVAAGLAWLILLLRAARAEGFATLVSQLGQLIPVPALGLSVVTVLFPMLAAGGGALVASALVRRPGAPSLKTSRNS